MKWRVIAMVVNENEMARATAMTVNEVAHVIVMTEN